MYVPSNSHMVERDKAERELLFKTHIDNFLEMHMEV